MDVDNAATNSDEPFWKHLARVAFHGFLESKREPLVRLRELKRKQGLADLTPDETIELYSTENSDDGADDEVEEGLKLPWMPSKSVVPELLAILSVAKSITSVAMIEQICSPSNLTELRMPRLSAEESDQNKAISEAIDEWATLHGIELGERDIHVSFTPSASSNSSSVRRTERSEFIGKIEKRLRLGNAAVVIARDLGTDFPELAELVELTVTATPLDREGMVELIKALHAEAAALPDGELFELLPDDQVLKQLSATRIEMALRQQSAEALLRQLHRKPRTIERSHRVTLADVHGQVVAVAQLETMVRDLERWKAGDLQWSEASTSAVMYGPPGNGKTLLAEAVAGSAGIPLVATSYAECQSFGHQGDMLKALMTAFQKAKDEVPSVLFIDEIDGFSARGSDNHNDGYMRGVVNGLLTELSRAVKTPGLILLAATNHLSVVDPAVIRPGRFDIKIPILNPDHAGIVRILSAHLGESSFERNERKALSDLARNLVGISGAQAAAFARGALGLARARGRSVTIEDVIEACGLHEAEDVEYLHRRAIHEAGHAVVRIVSGLPHPDRIQLGRGLSFVESPALPYLTQETAEATLCAVLAGRAAELVCLGNVSSGAGEGRDSDLAQATQLALKMETEWCLSAVAPWRPSEVMMTMGIPYDLLSRVAARLEIAADRAEKLIRDHEREVRRLAEALMERKEMSGVQISEALSEGPRNFAVLQ